MDRKQSRYVALNPRGQWEVRKPDGQRAIHLTKSKAAATERAKQIVANAGGGEVVINDGNGRVRKVSVSRQSRPYRSVGKQSLSPPSVVASPVSFEGPHTPTRPDGVLVGGVLIIGLSTEDAEDAIKLLDAARQLQYDSGAAAAHGLLQTMTEAKVELIPPASVEQARRLASLRRVLLSTPVFTHETLGELRGDANASTTRTWVSRARDRRQLFTVKVEGRTVIPALQLTEGGKTRNEYASVLAPLLEADIDGWTIWTWLTSATPLLSGAVPADLVAEAPERVSNAARRFASARRSTA